LTVKERKVYKVQKMSESFFENLKKDFEGNTSIFGLKNKVAIITGGTRGIGLAIASGFAKCGVKAVVASRKQSNVDKAIHKIETEGGTAYGVSAHMGKLNDIERLMRETVDQFGTLDILVNNAAINPVFGPLTEIPDDAWERIVSVNISGYFRCARAAARIMMAKKGGIIINISSMGAFKTGKGMGAYCISKAAIVMLTKVLSRELGSFKIRVNCIAPGMVETDFSQAIASNAQRAKEMLADIPIGRFAVPQDIVGTAIFLASDQSSYINGHTLCLDGGRSA
jgi:dehydrogenase/reductase SDR family protein 4